jgi:dihydrofolate synthase/folylpolyglutamate synthase
MNFNTLFDTVLQRASVSGVGVEGLKNFLVRLENPHTLFSVIHVAGTNGKGSVSTLLAGALTAAGYKTGLFVSPHLTDPAERIQINGKNISKQAFSQALERVLQTEKEPLNFFEILTAAAFVCFANAHVKYVVLETGLGGRKDPTNVCLPVCSIITSIGKDHTQYLGNTLSQIATEKAGIIKRAIPVFCGDVKPAALRVIRQTATRLQAPLTVVKEGDFFVTQAYKWRKNNTMLKDISKRTWKLHILGEKQGQNACLVYRVCKQLGIADTCIRKAFATVSLPGRFEIKKVKNTIWIFDGAHNPQAVENLVSLWKKTPFYPNGVLVCAFMRDKDYKKMLKLLSPHFAQIIVTQIPSKRSAMAEEIKATCPFLKNVCYEKNCRRALERAAKFSCAVCSGSFYWVGLARQKLV